MILFGIAALLAFAFLVGVLTSSTAVSIMVTYGIFFFAAVLSATREDFGGGLLGDGARRSSTALYWIFPKTAELLRATVELVSGGQTFQRLGQINAFAVFGSTAVFGIVALGLAAWRFSRKDF